MLQADKVPHLHLSRDLLDVDGLSLWLKLELLGGEGLQTRPGGMMYKGSGSKVP